jgi:hypothetical protein
MEAQLSQYGIFGLWTVSNLLIIKYFMYNQDKRETELLNVIKNNTEVISKFLERTKFIKR